MTSTEQFIRTLAKEISSLSERLSRNEDRVSALRSLIVSAAIGLNRCDEEALGAFMRAAQGQIDHLKKHQYVVDDPDLTPQERDEHPGRIQTMIDEMEWFISIFGDEEEMQKHLPFEVIRGGKED